MMTAQSEKVNKQPKSGQERLGLLWLYLPDCQQVFHMLYADVILLQKLKSLHLRVLRFR